MDERKNLPQTLIEAIRYFSDQDVCVQFVAKLRVVKIGASVIGRRLVTGREAGPGVWWKAWASSALLSLIFDPQLGKLRASARPVCLNDAMWTWLPSSGR